MWTLLVVGSDVLGQDTLEVTDSHDEEVVEGLGADRQNPSLRIGVRVRCLDGRPDHLCPFGLEDGVERARELGVTVSDQEPGRRNHRVCSHRQLAGPLHHPRGARVIRHPGEMDPTGADLDKEQHVEGPKADGLDGEEVRRHDAVGLGTKEPPPAQRCAPRGRLKAMGDEDGSDARRRHADPELGELALDPPAAPPVVLGGETNDEGDHVVGQRRPTRGARSGGRRRPSGLPVL